MTSIYDLEYRKFLIGSESVIKVFIVNANGQEVEIMPTTLMKPMNRYAAFFQGRYYDNIDGPISQAVKTGNIFRGSVIVPPIDMRVDEIGFELSADGTGFGRVVVYRFIDNRDLTSLVKVFEGTNINLSTAGYYSHGAENFDFNKENLYLMGVVSSESITLRDLNVGSVKSIGRGNGVLDASYGDNFTFNVDINVPAPNSPVFSGITLRPPIVSFRLAQFL